jgi:hypothetical protein
MLLQRRKSESKEVKTWVKVKAAGRARDPANPREANETTILQSNRWERIRAFPQIPPFLYEHVRFLVSNLKWV